jgi:hypothetical protein
MKLGPYCKNPSNPTSIFDEWVEKRPEESAPKWEPLNKAWLGLVADIFQSRSAMKQRLYRSLYGDLGLTASTAEFEINDSMTTSRLRTA